MLRSKVPGYREGLNVYQTFICPRTDSAWTSASLRMNCNVGGDQPFNHYYCIPNAERTHFVEFCYDRASLKTEKGNCWELGGIGYLNQVNCTNFVKGCPDYTYLSEQVYNICIRVLDQDGMFQGTIMLSEELRQPRGLCIDDDGYVYVGTYSLISKYKYLTASQTTENSDGKHFLMEKKILQS
uniref:Uncharacterized protein n=1 Tax=Magallana gigas TaxID=29159 RepID=A0A8W8ILY0_MAGGI